MCLESTLSHFIVECPATCELCTHWLPNHAVSTMMAVTLYLVHLSTNLVNFVTFRAIAHERVSILRNGLWTPLLTLPMKLTNLILISVQKTNADCGPARSFTSSVDHDFYITLTHIILNRFFYCNSIPSYTHTHANRILAPTYLNVVNRLETFSTATCT
jgi:hypothetical protein